MKQIAIVSAKKRQLADIKEIENYSAVELGTTALKSY